MGGRPSMMSVLWLLLLHLAAATHRIERDSLGEVQVPAFAYWGSSTQRSIQNFQIGEHRMPHSFLRALAMQKEACARANHERLSQEAKEAIIGAAREVQEAFAPEAGRSSDAFDERKQLLRQSFPLVIFQTGSGTQTNMNMNEVIANLANEILGQTKRGTKTPVHPNDHVNMAQSSNDSFPTAMHVAIYLLLKEKLLPSLAALRDGLRDKAKEFNDIVKVGRTHLMDATPLTLGQEFSSWAMQLEHGEQRIVDSMKRLAKLPQGGTAVGTGLNTLEGFDEDFVQHLRKITGEAAFVVAANKFEAGIAANDPGSSIMPGKVNPTQAEALTMVAAQVM